MKQEPEYEYDEMVDYPQKPKRQEGQPILTPTQKPERANGWQAKEVDRDSNGSGKQERPWIVKIVGGILSRIWRLISFIISVVFAFALLFAKLDPGNFNFAFQNVCILSTCVQVAVRDNQPTPMPVIPGDESGGAATFFDCVKPGLPPVQTDQLQITVNSIEIEKTNIDLNKLSINVTVENRTNSEVILDLDQNLRILQSQPRIVISSPLVARSVWVSTLPPLATVVQEIKISQISDIIASIDIEFLDSFIGNVEYPGITVSGIPSSC